jgi:curved DNA-binding protein CbpA
MAYLLMGNSMKDFYKILGVKKNASEEEIRVRWIELTKRYHPDRGEDKTSGEKIREINEAYQILKHSSTRVEYDLRRAYGQEKREGERESYFKKLGVPVSILFVFIIISVIYVKNSQSPTSPEIIVSNKIDKIDQTNQRNEINQRNQIDQIGQTNPIDPTTQKLSVASKPQRIVTLTQPQQRIDVPTQQPQLATSTPAVPITLNQRNQTNQINQRNQIDPTIQMNSTNPTNPITQLPNNLMTNRFPDPIESMDAMTQRLPAPPDTTDLQLQLAQFKPPSLLATEEEAIQFFGKYIERYKQKDIDGFLSLFSSRATQNRKDGLDGIRKIYTDFFDRSQTLRYRMVDRKIEIYENGVEVRARYELEQILIKSGEKKVWRGTIRWVLVKEDGILKIISLDYQHERPS